MNKKEFIKTLEQNLKILDENELKDIINEYNDSIDEKVKHGKTEQEAVKDFGDIDELTKEILKAYKINPKYNEQKEEKINAKEVIDDFESWVKKSSKKMADFSKSIYNDFKKNNNDLTIELVFEILIKVIILLILFAVLRLPFEFINSLGKVILDIAFYPLDRILMFVWEIIIFLLYFVCCILISIAMFKNYFNKKEVKKTPKKKEVKEEKIEVETKKEVKASSKESTTSIVSKILKVILQIFIVLCVLIPLWFINFGLIIVLVLGIYYLCIGINTIGFVLLLVGLLILFEHLLNIFNSIAFNHKKIHFYPFLISLLFIVLGFLLTIHTLFNIEYIDTLPLVDFNENINTYEFDVNKETIIYANNIKYIVDNTIENNKIKIEAVHYDELVRVDYYKNTHNKDCDYISLYTIGKTSYNEALRLYNLIIDNLKDNKFYKYELLYNSNITVYVNENTMNLIKKD